MNIKIYGILANGIHPYVIDPKAVNYVFLFL